ncbi:MAG: polynucleotide adenylyltransferase [Opitutaceae bacterium]|jgi:tRNA nucleotidyltransferase (CCA-adding enzyme)|nr:polynucleotide adenylyltransferase [Opitutaceae bacterium]
MNLPPELRAVLETLRRHSRPRLAGGCVRDSLLGIPVKDYDIEVGGGITFERLHALLAPFGATDVVGRSFGVIKLRLRGREYDFSLPRRESKTGAGHRGFAVRPDPDLTDAEAAARRDFTLNSIACDPFTGELIDPFGGQRDLRAKILRHTSPAFTEDPLRVLRAFQFAARFDLVLAPETAALCRSISATHAELPAERVWGEWAKWAAQSVRPSRGLDVLVQTGWLAHYPEIAALRGTPQEPDWHPEGDVFAHTAHCCDALASLPEYRLAEASEKLNADAHRRVLMFATLAHDFGKPSVTTRAERRGRLRWTSPGHEAAGVPLAESFLRRVGAPHFYAPLVTPLVKNHLVHHSGNGLTQTQIRRLARRLAPATVNDLCAVMSADALGRPPLDGADSLALIAALRQGAAELALATEAPKPLLRGRDLVALGMRPGPRFKPVLRAAFEAQLEGVFDTADGARAWLATHLAQNKPRPRP